MSYNCVNHTCFLTEKYNFMLKKSVSFPEREKQNKSADLVVIMLIL